MISGSKVRVRAFDPTGALAAELSTPRQPKTCKTESLATRLVGAEREAFLLGRGTDDR